MNYSPFGHKKVKLPKVIDLSGVLLKQYSLRPGTSNLHWAFIKRDKKKELRRTSAVQLSEPFDPTRTDPFVWKSIDHYNKTLNTISSLADKVNHHLNSVGLQWKDNSADNISNFLKNYKQSDDMLAASILRSEAEILNKFTIQRYISSYWYVTENDSHEMQITSSQHEVLQALIEYACSIFRPNELSIDDVVDPLETNSGAPFFKSEGIKGLQGIDVRLQIANLYKGIAEKSLSGTASLNRDSMIKIPKAHVDIIAQISDTYGISESAVIGVGVARRFGPSRDKITLDFVDRGAITADYGYYNVPRIRQVYMAPHIYNWLVSPFVAVMKGIRKKVPGWYHTQEDFQLRSKIKDSFFPNGIQIESDVSSLDKTMSLNHRAHLLKVLAAKFKDIIPEISSIYALNHSFLSVLMPDPYDRDENSTSFLEAIPRIPTGLYSGIKLTSEIDSWFVMWCTLHTLMLHNLINLDDIRKGTWFKKVYIENSGDDILCTFKNIAELQIVLPHWENDYKSFGLQVRMDLGTRFLMQHNAKGHRFPVLSRILQQTLSNESQRLNGDIFSLGMLARSSGYPAFKSMLTKLKCNSDIKTGLSYLVTSIEEIISETKSGGALIDMMNMTDRLPLMIEIGNRIQKSSTNIEQLLEYIIDNRFSATGRELIQALTPQLIALIKDQESKAKKVYLHIASILGMNRLCPYIYKPHN